MAYSKQITFTSPAAPSTVAVADQFTGLAGYSRAKIIAETVGATGGDLNIYLQGWNGIDWFDVAALPTLEDGDLAAVISGHIGRQDMPPFPFFNFYEIGLNDAPALWEGGVDMGDFGEKLRILCVAGAGTTAGADIAITVFSYEDHWARP